MRAITKGSADYHLAQRHQSPPSTSAEAETAWDNFRGERKHTTRDKCLAEQYFLCVYSEISLDNYWSISDAAGVTLDRALGIHLEHVEPKSRYPQRTFDHQNLVACAIDDAKARGLLAIEVFGGHAKQRWYNANAFIHPLLANCRDYFHYEISGRVVPSQKLPTRRERAKARLTIYKLNLNSPVLVNWRKHWLQQAAAVIDELLDNEAALCAFAETELLPTNGHLRPFHSAQRQLFGKLGQYICAAHQPPL